MLIVYVQLFIFNLRLEPILVSIVLFYRALNSTLAVQSAFQTTFQNIGSMELVHEEFLNQKKTTDAGNERYQNKKKLFNFVFGFFTPIILFNLFAYKSINCFFVVGFSGF